MMGRAEQRLQGDDVGQWKRGGDVEGCLMATVLPSCVLHTTATVRTRWMSVESDIETALCTGCEEGV
jgi:hypothetical protein